MLKNTILTGCFLVLFSFMIIGCGSDQGSQPKSSSNTSSDSQTSADKPKLDLDSDKTSEGVTNQFFKAFFGGDDQKAFSLLTPLAQKVTKDTFSASANDTIRWNVTSKEENKEAAQVFVSIRDLDESGDLIQEELIFHLCKNEGSWGVAGFSSGENKISFETVSQKVDESAVEVSQKPSETHLQ